MWRSKTTMKKFTLIELLIILAIIAILLSLLLPSLGKSRYLSKNAVCLSNQAQFYRGVLLVSKYKQKIPSGSSMKRNPWDSMIANDLEDIDIPLDIMTCAFSKAPASTSEKTYISLGTWYKEGGSGEVNRWTYRTPQTLALITSDHLFISDLVNQNGGAYTPKWGWLTNMHKYNGKIIDICSTYGDGHSSVKKFSESSSFSFSNQWGLHWRAKLQPNEEI